MLSKLALLSAVFLHSYIVFTLASDPDPTRDFCISTTGPSGPCKNTSSVTVGDFVFSGLRFAGNFSQTGLSSKLANVDVFPGLNTLGMALVRADFDVGGINPPHLHPRATEIAFVLRGRVYSGFVDTENKVFAKVLEEGEVMVFPRGLIHFQMNAGRTPATILGSFNSQNPGLLRIPNAVFGSGIESEVLEKAFWLSAEQVNRMRRKLAPH